MKIKELVNSIKKEQKLIRREIKDMYKEKSVPDLNLVVKLRGKLEGLEFVMRLIEIEEEKK